MKTENAAANSKRRPRFRAVASRVHEPRKPPAPAPVPSDAELTFQPQTLRRRAPRRTMSVSSAAEAGLGTPSSSAAKPRPRRTAATPSSRRAPGAAPWTPASGRRRLGGGGLTPKPTPSSFRRRAEAVSARLDERRAVFEATSGARPRERALQHMRSLRLWAVQVRSFLAGRSGARLTSSMLAEMEAALSEPVEDTYARVASGRADPGTSVVHEAEVARVLDLDEGAEEEEEEEPRYDSAASDVTRKPLPNYVEEVSLVRDQLCQSVVAHEEEEEEVEECSKPKQQQQKASPFWLGNDLPEDPTGGVLSPVPPPAVPPQPERPRTPRRTARTFSVDAAADLRAELVTADQRDQWPLASDESKSGLTVEVNEEAEEQDEEGGADAKTEAAAPARPSALMRKAGLLLGSVALAAVLFGLVLLAATILADAGRLPDGVASLRWM